MSIFFKLKYKTLSFLFPSNGVKQALRDFFKDNSNLYISELYFREEDSKTFILLYWNMPEPIDGIQMLRMQSTYIFDKENRQLKKIKGEDHPLIDNFSPLLKHVRQSRSSMQYYLFRLKNILSLRPKIK